jgi:hypothetical protein
MFQARVTNVRASTVIAPEFAGVGGMAIGFRGTIRGGAFESLPSDWAALTAQNFMASAVLDRRCV